jgi:uncharacterized membrane protein
LAGLVGHDVAVPFFVAVRIENSKVLLKLLGRGENMRRLVVAHFAIFVCLHPSLAEVRYNLIDLGPGKAVSVNNQGQILGSSGLLDATGAGNNVTLVSGNGSVSAISNTGLIVGQAMTSPAITPSEYHATLFDPTGHGNNVDLGSLGGTQNSRAMSVNDSGQIVGYSDFCVDDRTISHATLFDPSGSGNNIDIGIQPMPFPASQANSINGKGQIVGWSYNSLGYDYSQCAILPGTAVLFRSAGNGVIDLGTIPYLDFENSIYPNSSLATAINNNGQIVGAVYECVSGHMHAALFDATGNHNNIDLGALSGSNAGSEALAINNNGVIVGWAGNSAMLFDSSGHQNNLTLDSLIDPGLGWHLTMAYSINDNGWIVGQGDDPQGNTRAFLLTPVPEPATLTFFALGFVASTFRHVGRRN